MPNVTFVAVKNKNRNIDNLLSLETMVDFDLDFNKLFKQNEQLNKAGLSFSSLTINMVNATNFDYKNHSAQLKKIILEKYPELFEERTGCVPDYQVNLNIDHSVKTIRVPPQMVPIKMINATKTKLDKWVADGIIEPISYNEHVGFVSSLNPVEKEHGKEESEPLTKDDVRLTINCKNVNKAVFDRTVLFYQTKDKSNTT